MRQVPITFDTDEFQSEIKRVGKGKVPVMCASGWAKVPEGVYILAGNKTKEMGGGLSGTGYVMQRGKATHSVAVSSTDVSRRYLRVP